MLSAFGGVGSAMFVFTSISPIVSLSLNIQFLTDDKGKKSRALMLVASVGQCRQFSCCGSGLRHGLVYL